MASRGGDVNTNSGDRITINATMDQINTTLSNGGLKYTGGPDFNGPTQVSVVVKGEGDSVGTSAEIAININPIDDAPRLTAIGGNKQYL
jgi:hypothetical protein